MTDGEIYEMVSRKADPEGHNEAQAIMSALTLKAYQIENLEKALRKAFNMGQTYWQQADSDFARDWKRSDETAKKFELFVDKCCKNLFSNLEI